MNTPNWDAFEALYKKNENILRGVRYVKVPNDGNNAYDCGAFRVRIVFENMAYKSYLSREAHETFKEGIEDAATVALPALRLLFGDK